MILLTGYGGIHPHSQGYISSYSMIIGRAPMVAKAHPVNAEYEAKAKNLLKAELRRRGVTYAQLAERLTAMGVDENERNLNNKISRGGFTAAFMIQCLSAIGANSIRLDELGS